MKRGLNREYIVIFISKFDFTVKNGVTMHFHKDCLLLKNAWEPDVWVQVCWYEYS